MAARAKLIVLTGLHNGAAAPVGNVVTLLGSGGECDVVLTDKGIAALHASLSMGGDQPVLRRHVAARAAAADAPAAADAEPGCDEVPADWYTPFALGPAWLCLVPAAFEWGESMEWSAPAGLPSAEAGAAAAVADTAAPARRWGALRGSRWQIALVAALLALVIGEGVALAPRLGRPQAEAVAQRLVSPGPAAPPQQPDTVGRLTQAIRAAQLDDVMVQAGGGRLTVTGFVDSDEQLARLNSELRTAAPQGVLMQVKAGSELARRAQQFLADPGIEVRYEGAGRIRLAGRPTRTRPEDALVSKLAQLRADLGAQINLTDEIDHGGARSPEGKPVEHRMPIRIAEVQVDEPAHFRTVDGARYFQGARLPDGAEVVRISAREILFRRGGREISYAVAE